MEEITVTILVVVSYDAIHAKEKSSPVYLRDGTKENEFSFTWIVSHNNRTRKVTRSECVSVISFIPNN
jgi:hypothetical protein